MVIRPQLQRVTWQHGCVHTIQYHLQRRHRLRKAVVPSASSIWRMLKHRGFIVPQPHKRPKCSCVPSCPTSAGRQTPPTGRSPTAPTSGSSTSSTTAPGWWSPRGLPSPPRPPTWWQLSRPQLQKLAAGVAVDRQRGHIHAENRGGRCAIKTLLLALGVTYKHGQPYHPRPITEPGCDDSLSPVVSTSLAITHGPRHGARRVHGWFGGAALELVDCTVAGCHIHGSSLVIGGK